MHISSIICFHFFFLQILLATRLSSTYLCYLALMNHSWDCLYATIFATIVCWHSSSNRSFQSYWHPGVGLVSAGFIPLTLRQISMPFSSLWGFSILNLTWLFGINILLSWGSVHCRNLSTVWAYGKDARCSLFLNEDIINLVRLRSIWRGQPFIVLFLLPFSSLYFWFDPRLNFKFPDNSMLEPNYSTFTTTVA